MRHRALIAMTVLLAASWVCSSNTWASSAWAVVQTAPSAVAGAHKVSATPSGTPMASSGESAVVEAAPSAPADAPEVSVTPSGTPMASSGESVVVEAASSAVAGTPEVSLTPSATPIEFAVSLKLHDAAQAAAVSEAVSDPASSSYGQYLTPAEWESRFSPSEASVERVSSWLRAHGVAVESVSSDRMTVYAIATAATIENAFGTSLAEFQKDGHVVRLAKAPLSMPSSLASLISGLSGVNQNAARPDDLGASALQRSAAAPAAKSEPIPPPPGLSVFPPCSKYWGQKYDTNAPPYGKGYPNPLPYAPCGYKPAQIQGAYDLAPGIAAGDDGSGVKVAIVDAYASPTLFSDAHEYSMRNQPEQPLEQRQFSEHVSRSFNESEYCEASEDWFREQTLDVESVHSTAPGAHILYVGAKNCEGGLYAAVQKVIDGHEAQIVTDSWSDFGELFESEKEREGFDNVLMMADATGVGVQFSTGDYGDDYELMGINSVNFPASSPYVTAVGGTSLQIGKHDERLGEFGWSTGNSFLCDALLESIGYPGCGSKTLETWLPSPPGSFQYGGNGGTAYDYPEPSYQEAVVPAALAERNSAITGERNRVTPDISMDAEPSTGLLIGETMTFPGGVHYGEYTYGGTSLASPLFAGLMADADQAAGKALGFVNPALYKLDSLPQTASRAFYDIVPSGKQALIQPFYLNDYSAKEGTVITARTIEYEGKQSYCDGAGGCESETNILQTAPGFDSMTGIGSPGENLVAELANP
jgi:subtilase family serine protease